MPSESIEDYIKVIHALEVEHGSASTKHIAERLGVTMASVTGMAKHLAAEGYVSHTPYYGMKVTEMGRQMAARMLRRHRLIELFLSRTLGLEWDELHDDAEVLEHAVSERLIDRIDEFLGRPQFDPHGSPIPGKDGPVPPRQGIPLNVLAANQPARLVEVEDDDPEFLRYLTTLGLHIGAELIVQDRAPFEGPITLRVDDRTVVVGVEAGRRIRVAPISASTT